MSDEWWTTLDLPNDTCGVEVYGRNCTSIMPATTNANIVSIARIAIAFISLVGTLTIIVSAIIKRQILHPMIHPIFVLSVADFLLAVLWMAGGVLWFSQAGRGYSIVGCAAVSVSTVVLICVSVNLTLVYAIFAYIYIKHSALNMPFQVLQSNDESAARLADVQYRIHPCKTIIAYVIAWLLPVVLEVVSFGTVAIKTGVYTAAKRCSCWCLPVQANVQPFAYGTDVATAEFVTQLTKIWVANATVITFTYSVVLPLLVVIYYKIFKHVRKIRRANSHAETDAVLAKGESQARKMVVKFMFVFIFTGISNLVLTLEGLILGIGHVWRGTVVLMRVNSSTLTFIGLLFQALSVPLQGFLNALVYGWTRKSFINAISKSTKKTMSEMDGASTRIVEPDRLGEYQTFDHERSAFLVTVFPESATAI